MAGAYRCSRATTLARLLERLQVHEALLAVLQLPPTAPPSVRTTKHTH
jgi:hypothetical protein